LNSVTDLLDWLSDDQSSIWHLLCSIISSSLFTI
jgi:hypothetical protein